MTEADVTVITDGLEFPEGPVWMDDGSVLVAELMGKRVTRVAPDGTRTVLATGLSFATSLRMGPDGALYVSNFGFGPPGLGEIVRITF